MGLEEVLSAYRKDILSIEHDVLRDPGLPVAYLQSKLQDYELVFTSLHNLVIDIDNNNLQGGELLTEVHRASVCGWPKVEAVMLRILFLCNTVWYNQIVAWMVHGLLIDKHEEFFIQEDSAQPEAEIRRAVEFDSLSDETHWERRFSIRHRMLPAYITESVAERILFVGRALRVLKHPDAKRSADGEFVMPTSDVESFTQQLERVRQDPKNKNHVTSFEVAVGKIRKTVAQRLWHLIVIEAKLPTTLQKLKDYFLLAKGGFYEEFVHEARQIMVLPPNMVNAEADINGIFQQAASKAACDDDELFKRLRLRLDPPESVTKGSALTVDAWRGLSLELEVKWPFHLLLDEGCRMKYNSLFHFLFQVKRVQSELQKAWVPQMGYKHLPKHERARIMPAWRLRTNMSFLVNNLQYYLQVDVIETQFEVLREKISNSEDYETVCEAHNEYLNSLHGQCFLGMKPITRSLDDIFNLCLQFSNMILTNDSNALDLEEVASMVKQFRRYATFLLTVLRGVKRKLQSSPYLTNLAQLLLRIDYNNFFSNDMQPGI